MEALACLHHEVSVLIYRPSEDPNHVLNKRSGTINGVRYESSAINHVRPNNPILVRLARLLSYPRALLWIYHENHKGKIDVIIQASSKSSMIPLIYFLSRILGIKYLLENSEYPWFLLKKKRSNIFYKILYLHVYYKLFDGFIPMTKKLVSYHKKYARRGAVFFHMPMTVDEHRFVCNVKSENWITYVGYLSYYKDGVEDLLEAFFIIAPQFPDWKLVLVGDTSRDSLIIEKVKSAGLMSRVVLKGNVHRDEVPHILCSSKILVLARPDNLQSEGGFPTKLGEYLATRRLVVITNVGEISDYLVNGESALISPPGDIRAFASSLSYAILNYKDLGNIMENGFQVCKQKFSAEVQAKKLSSFLSSLVSHTS
jgi:glycosyltransferase involved in cell wall biosynthesis